LATALCCGLFAADCVAQSPPAQSETTFSDSVATAVREARKKYQLPAVGTLVFDIDGNTLAHHVDGTLSVTDDTPVALDSLWHLGSNTKAITATVAAILVDKAQISFDTTVAEALPGLIVGMNGAATDITLAHLLNHTAGLPANPTPEEKKRILAHNRNFTMQRIEVARWALSKKPISRPGTKYLYSNTGYIVAGAMLEEATRKSWEHLVIDHIFRPLGISKKQAGFGPPKGRQPEGHRPTVNAAGDTAGPPFTPAGQNSDNPAFYGPAGTLNMSLEAWKKIALEHLREGRTESKSLLKASSYRRLHTPGSAVKDYAYGWGLLHRGAGISPVLVHNGSNTEWYARILLDREVGVGILLVTNAGTDGARTALDEIAKSINDKLFGKK
jgi:CubicO group peptidase (beta-lactamase class C family)